MLKPRKVRMIEDRLKQKERRYTGVHKKVALLTGATAVTAAIIVPSLLAPDQAEAATVSQSVQRFIHQIAPQATKIASQNDLYASVMISQALLESGYGTSALSQAPNYNLFGIKGAYHGQSIALSTQEDAGNNHFYTTTADFRKYPSFSESLQDYAAILRHGTSRNATYYQGAWKSNARSYKEATRALTGTYATDTTYNEKLNQLIERYSLTAYDQDQPSKDTTIKWVTVKAGDTLSKIATQQKQRVVDLKNWNQLRTDTIYPGQKLKVSDGFASYVIKKGDTLWQIAKVHHTTVESLMRQNDLRTTTIYIGQKLTLPRS